MRIFYLPRDEKANISMDFLTAVAVIIIGFVFAVSVLSSMITPYSGYSKELYPTADRAVTLLVEDEGYFNSGYDEGTDWESKWNNNNSNVKKIGFQESKEKNNLDSLKIESLMKPQLNWWEYPVDATSKAELDNASRAMGLGRYNFYMQIRPIDESNYNVDDADGRAIEVVGDKGDIVSVVRYSMLDEKSFADFDGGNLYGSYEPKKVLFGIERKDFPIIETGGRLKFSISNWTVINENGNIQKLEIDDEMKNNKTVNAITLKGINFDMWKNNGTFDISDTSASINMPIQNSSDYVTIEIPIQTFDEILPGWNTSEEIFIQMNVDKLEIKDTGVTWFDSASGGKTYSVKTVLWVW